MGNDDTIASCKILMKSSVGKAFRERSTNMRHGWGLFHGFVGNDGIINGIWVIILAVIAFVLLILVVRVARKRNHTEHIRLMDILKAKYADKTIGASEFRERSMILGDEDWIDETGPDMLKLKERYARCEIDSREYVRQREEFLDQKRRSTESAFNEPPVR